MTDWQNIETAPKDRRLLMFGQMRPMDGLRVNGPEVFTGYWDEIDSAWCGSGSTYEGPFLLTNSLAGIARAATCLASEINYTWDIWRSRIGHVGAAI